MRLLRRPVDFIGQDEMGKDRSLFGPKAAECGVEDASSNDVRGQQVGSELNALELRADRVGERHHRQRFGQSGHPLEQDMGITHFLFLSPLKRVGDLREKADQEPLDQPLLPDNDAIDLPGDPIDRR